MTWNAVHAFLEDRASGLPNLAQQNGFMTCAGEAALKTSNPCEKTSDFHGTPI
jgi:hypothetical protein